MKIERGQILKTNNAPTLPREWWNIYVIVVEPTEGMFVADVEIRMNGRRIVTGLRRSEILQESIDNSYRER